MPELWSGEAFGPHWPPFGWKCLREDRWHIGPCLPKPRWWNVPARIRLWRIG